MKKIADSIVKKNNLEENLGIFAHNMMRIYNDYSYVRFSMNYYTYCEIVKETQNKSDSLKSLTTDLGDIIENGIVKAASGKEWEILIQKTDNIRNKVIDIMKGLTSYVDIFNIYEYCLNRIEYKYVEADVILERDDEDLSAHILRYILSDKDNIVINSKITELVRQLPVRMTKNKFFELLTEGIKVYKGSEKSSVDDFLYMLKTSSMLEIADSIHLLNKDIKAVYDEFRNISFAEINKEKYYDLKSKLDFAVAYITSEINIYMALGELINDAYVILLSSPYKLNDSRYSENAVNIIREIKQQFESEDVNFEDELAENFTVLEGAQEKLYEQFSSYEYIIDDVLEENKDMLQSLMLDKIYNSLKRITILESGSIFADFELKNTEIADEKYVKEATEKLISQFKDIFSQNERIINRAIMASALSALPVFFGNVEEIKDYVINSLKQCADKRRKQQ